jgi:hypothetical protein
METRPLSKLKSWRLIRIVSKAPAGTAKPAAEKPAPEKLA